MSDVDFILEHGLYERESGVTREWIVLVGDRGSIEMWRCPTVSGAFGETHYGGIEIHAKAPLWEGQEARSGYCRLVNADCYTEGSSLAFDNFNVNRIIGELDWRGARAVLTDWYESHFEAKS